MQRTHARPSTLSIIDRKIQETAIIRFNWARFMAAAGNTGLGAHNIGDYMDGPNAIPEKNVQR